MPKHHHDALHERFQDETWIVCRHTASITQARLLPAAGAERPFAGEALCARCQRDLDEQRAREQNYRVSCGACVRTRWPLDASALPS